MGLFSMNYSKPGPGVDANEPEKKGFFRFWEVFAEKFSKLIGANSLHALLSIVYIAIMFFLAPINDTSIQNLVQGMVSDTSIDVASTALNFSLMFRLMFSIGIFMLWGSGPATAMYAYITRCYTTRTPVWIISDGFAKYKENFKQSIIVSIIDIVVLILGKTAIAFYYSMYTNSKNILFMILFSLLIMMVVIYTWMHFYIYQLMVTYECSLKQLYKNSLIFAIGNLPMNLFVTVIALAVLASLYFVLTPIIAMLIDLIVLAIFMRFLIEFSASRKIKKVVINNEQPQEYKMEYFPEVEEDEK